MLYISQDGREFYSQHGLIFTSNIKNPEMSTEKAMLARKQFEEYMSVCRPQDKWQYK